MKGNNPKKKMKLKCQKCCNILKFTIYSQIRHTFANKWMYTRTWYTKDTHKIPLFLTYTLTYTNVSLCTTHMHAHTDFMADLVDTVGHSWSLQGIICPAITQKGFAGPGKLDESGFKVKIKQKNLPERYPALTHTHTHTNSSSSLCQHLPCLW